MNDSGPEFLFFFISINKFKDHKYFLKHQKKTMIIYKNTVKSQHFVNQTQQSIPFSEVGFVRRFEPVRENAGGGQRIFQNSR